MEMLSGNVVQQSIDSEPLMHVEIMDIEASPSSCIRLADLTPEKFLRSSHPAVERAPRTRA
jgi:hypothetical protein